jgi:hypothetical protein
LCAILGVLKLLYGHKLRVFEKAVFRCIFFFKRESKIQEDEENCALLNFIIPFSTNTVINGTGDELDK